jgi:hypothetical protein
MSTNNKLPLQGFALLLARLPIAAYFYREVLLCERKCAHHASGLGRCPSPRRGTLWERVIRYARRSRRCWATLNHLKARLASEGASGREKAGY